MTNQEESIDVLNDLVHINNDRIEGYEKAITLLKTENQELRPIFEQMVDESEAIKQELVTAIRKHDGESTSEATTQKGKIYRMWMDIRNAFSSDKEENVLELCEYGEDAAQKAYQEALESDDTQGADIRELIVRQKEQLRNLHNTIRNLRDGAKANKSSL
jgi:uncharacterized protein (TIGR02284 family)